MQPAAARKLTRNHISALSGTLNYDEHYNNLSKLEFFKFRFPNISSYA